MINEIFNKKHKELIQSTIKDKDFKAIISKFIEIFGNICISSKSGLTSSNINKSIDSNELNEFKECKSILFELSRQTVNKEYSMDNYFHVIEALNKDYSQILNEFLIEIIWLLGFILEKRVESEDKEIIVNYSTLVNGLIKRNIINSSSLFEKLEDSSLYDIGLINDKKMFKTRITRLNTKITYEQQKYNLYREESEGFAKLIFLLFQIQLTKENINNYIDKILCLIGFFDLDPNRVLDQILSAFQCDPFNTNYVEILKLFNRSAVPQILGFKFSNFSNFLNSQEKENYNGFNQPDDGLFIMTAQLLKHEIIEISEILPHLTPNMIDIEIMFKSQLDAAAEYYKHLQSRVSKELSLVNVPVNITEGQAHNANHFVNFPELLSEVYKKENSNLNPNSSTSSTSSVNQIYKLLEGLVKVRSFKHCEILYSLMENFYDPLLHTGLVKTLCDICHWMIEPIFLQFSMRKIFKNLNEKNDKIRKNSLTYIAHGNKNKYCENNYSSTQIYTSNSSSLSDPKSPDDFNQIHTPEEILSELPKILKFLTLGLSNDCILFSKILIILKGNSQLFSQRTEKNENYQKLENPQNFENLKILTDFICKVFLPSISLIDPTPGLTNDLWSIISLFEYSKRYKIYNFWLSNIYFTHPALYIKYGVVLKETAKWTKTLSKENQRPHGRLLGILTNSNPTIVFDNVIRLLTSYDNQINVFMQTLSFCSSLSYDVITFIISKILADPHKEKLNETNGDMNSWFRYFAYFIGHFFKKFHFAEFSGIFYFLTNRMKIFENDEMKEIVIEQYVIKEIIEKMSGTLIQEELNETQIYSCAGGTYLYLEAMDLIKDYKNLKKPISALLKFFMKNSRAEDEDLERLDGGKVEQYVLMQVENESGEIQEQIEVENINGVEDKYENYQKNGKNEKIQIFEKNGNSVKNINSQNYQSSNTLSFTSILLILLGIRRQNIIFNSKFTKSKLLGYLYDQMQNTFVQLTHFFTLYSDKENFAKFLPKWRLEKYILNYNCQPETLFFLIRNKLPAICDMSKQEYTDTMLQFQGVLDTYQSLNRKTFDDGFDSIYLEKSPFLDDLYKSVWKFISPELYFIFSALKLKDIYVPNSFYDFYIEKNKKEIEKMMTEENHTKKEIEKIKNCIENLEKEKIILKKNFEKIQLFLQEKKSCLLDDSNISKTNRRDISRYLIQYCLYPRLIFSKVEAVYSAKMLVVLINLKIQNVNVFDIMQKIVKFLLPCILCLTEYESQNLGVFLLEFLKVVKYWQDDGVWENECFSNPSFSRNLDTASPVDLSDFKKVIVCLLSKMNSTFLNIFNGEDYMSCRNAIIVLNTISAVYPPTKEIANELTTSIEKALEKFIGYEDLTMMMKRYRDILFSKKQNLPFEAEVTGEGKDREATRDLREVKESRETRDSKSDVKDFKESSAKDVRDNRDIQKDRDSNSAKGNVTVVTDKKKKKDKEKRREDDSRRSPEEYRPYKNRK